MVKQIKVKNLNNSLVFYRNLIGARPTVISPDQVHFQVDNLELELIEDDTSENPTTQILRMNSSSEVIQTYNRIKRFIINVKANPQCKIVDNRFGVKDPDGHGWIITSEHSEYENISLADSSFGQCYVESY